MSGGRQNNNTNNNNKMKSPIRKTFFPVEVVNVSIVSLYLNQYFRNRSGELRWIIQVVIRAKIIILS